MDANARERTSQGTDVVKEKYQRLFAFIRG